MATIRKSSKWKVQSPVILFGGFAFQIDSVAD